MVICTRCLLDEAVPGIKFDDKGECSYCKIHDQLEREYPLEKAVSRLTRLVEKIKQRGKGRRYDCVVGISGGCDSSYLLHKVKEWGLRPLAFHFDNNWNMPVAESNMGKMVKALNVDFLRIGVDKREYDDICRAFLLASVPDADIPNDIAITTLRYFIADKMGISYALSGHSFRTEGTTPLGWSYMDGKYVESVHDLFGSVEMKTYPNLWLSKWLRWSILNRVKRPRLLWFMDYQKEEAKKFLSEAYDWEWYGGHHRENKYTLFCSNYYQPKKFGIDLRHVECSALVRSGQMTRQEGLEALKQPLEVDRGILEEIKRRLNLTDDQFDRIMRQTNKTHRDYETYRPTFKRLRWLFYILSRFDIVPKTFYVKYTR